MCNRKPSIHTMAAANFDSWIHSPRTVIMAITIIMLCLLEMMRQADALNSTGVFFNTLESVYLLFSGNLSIVMASALFFVMVSELPRKISFQNSMLIRTTRKRWLLSQILYCLWTVITMLLLILICLFLFSLLFAVPDGSWSDTRRIANGEATQYEAIIPQSLRDVLSPTSAILYAMLPVFFFWFSMTMVILLSSLLGMPIVGLLICAFAFLSGYISSYEFQLPITYATSETINPQFVDIADYWNALLGYIILNVCLAAGTWLRVSKADLLFNNDNQF